MSAPATLWKGFRFGMLLQLAVGPVCLYVFRAAADAGLGAGELAVAGVAVVDGLFIALAALGVAAVIGRSHVKQWLKLFGAAVLLLFGAASVLDAFGVALLPGPGFAHVGSPFAGALALTASNPLTILFWAGVFSGRVAEAGMGRAEVWLFGAGALASTAAFLSLVAATGSLAGAFLPDPVSRLLNAAVGAALIAFGARQLIAREKASLPAGMDVGPPVSRS